MTPEAPGPPPPGERIAYLLSQLGALSAARFGERLEALDLQPSDVGLLRLILTNPGISQQALATKLGVVPSRVVVLVDRLEKKGLVDRVRSARDRRVHELQLAAGGAEAMARMRTIGAEHEADIVGVLDEQERRTLGPLLAKLAERHGIDASVHPGFRTM